MAFTKSPKIAVVTGAAQRVGAAIVRTVTEMGYTCVLHYFSSEGEALKLSQELIDKGRRVYPFKADLTNETEIQELWNFVDQLEGEPRLLINSASIMPRKKMGSIKGSEFDELISLNLRAPLLCSQEAAKRMSPDSLIINISDIASTLNWTGYPLYSISRSALNHLTSIMAKDYAPKIRVNGISLGLVIPPIGMQQSDWDKLIDKVPLKRAVDISELNMTIKYLVENNYVTGQTLVLDGGRTL